MILCIIKDSQFLSYYYVQAYNLSNYITQLVMLFNSILASHSKTLNSITPPDLTLVPCNSSRNHKAIAVAAPSYFIPVHSYIKYYM
jgi:hypothetical protein